MFSPLPQKMNKKGFSVAADRCSTRRAPNRLHMIGQSFIISYLLSCPPGCRDLVSSLAACIRRSQCVRCRFTRNGFSLGLCWCLCLKLMIAVGFCLLNKCDAVLRCGLMLFPPKRLRAIVGKKRKGFSDLCIWVSGEG